MGDVGINLTNSVAWLLVPFHLSPILLSLHVLQPLQAPSMATVKTGPASKAKRPPGQSIVNPLNKRKKAAGGVQFNDQEA